MPEEQTAVELRDPSIGGQAKPRMAVRPTGLGMAFWIKWILVNMPLAVLFASLMLLPVFLWASLPGTLLILPAFSLVVATLHWRVLRGAARVSAWWIPATTLGIVVGALLGVWVIDMVLRFFECHPRSSTFFGTFCVYSTTAHIVSWSFGLATVGPVLGAAQWLVLRPRMENRAGLWILACVFGFMVGGLVMSASMFAHYPVPLAILTLGVVYSAATGIALARMTFHSESRM